MKKRVNSYVRKDLWEESVKFAQVKKLKRNELIEKALIKIINKKVDKQND